MWTKNVAKITTEHERLMLRFGQRAMLAENGPASDSSSYEYQAQEDIAKDVERSAYLGTKEQVEAQQEQWRTAVKKQYTQGDIDGGSTVALLLPFTAMQLSHCNSAEVVDGQPGSFCYTLRTGYLDTQGQAAAVSFSFINGDPNLWTLNIVRNTVAVDPKDRAETFWTNIPQLYSQDEGKFISLSMTERCDLQQIREALQATAPAEQQAVTLIAVMYQLRRVLMLSRALRAAGDEISADALLDFLTALMRHQAGVDQQNISVPTEAFVAVRAGITGVSPAIKILINNIELFLQLGINESDTDKLIATINQRNALYNALAIIHDKANQLAEEGFEIAAVKAHSLIRSIVGETERNYTPEQFKQACQRHIEDARPVLEVHRGWKEVFANLGIALGLGGVGYLLAGAVNYLVNGRFSFHVKTRSEEKLDQLSESLGLKASRSPRQRS